MPGPSMEDTMRARFHELQAERAGIAAEQGPLRARYDAVSAEISALKTEKLDPLKAELRPLEDRLFDIDREIGRITRFLRDGHFAATGDAPDAPSA